MLKTIRNIWGPMPHELSDASLRAQQTAEKSSLIQIQYGIGRKIIIIECEYELEKSYTIKQVFRNVQFTSRR